MTSKTVVTVTTSKEKLPTTSSFDSMDSISSNINSDNSSFTTAKKKLTDAITSSGLVHEGDRGIVMLSGGADSTCLLTGLSAVLGAENLVALHVNYGLREESGYDESVAAELCERLGVRLEIVRAGSPVGNTQEWARDLCYEAAMELKQKHSANWIAVGHNRSDKVETMIYRLAASPGTRSLIGMRDKRGDIIRPIISLGRDEIRSIAATMNLTYAEDRSNKNPAYARVRVREEILPLMSKLNKAAELNIERTYSELVEDEELLNELAKKAITDSKIKVARLRELHPSLRRRALRLLAEEELNRPVVVRTDIASEVLRLGLDPEGGRVDAGKKAFFFANRGWIAVEPPKD